jgi:hypothetical protein
MRVCQVSRDDFPDPTHRLRVIDIIENAPEIMQQILGGDRSGRMRDSAKATSSGIFESR